MDQQIGLRKCKHITWKPRGRVWFRKNDDSDLGKKEVIADPEDTKPIKQKSARLTGYSYINTEEDELH